MESVAHKTHLNLKLTGQTMTKFAYTVAELEMLYYAHGVYFRSHEKDVLTHHHIQYESQKDNAYSRLFAVASLWTVTHHLNLSLSPFPCTPSHLPFSSLPDKGVTKMTKDSLQNGMQHQAMKSTQIQFYPQTNII